MDRRSPVDQLTQQIVRRARLKRAIEQQDRDYPIDRPISLQCRRWLQFHRPGAVRLLRNEVELGGHLAEFWK